MRLADCWDRGWGILHPSSLRAVQDLVGVGFIHPLAFERSAVTPVPSPTNDRADIQHPGAAALSMDSRADMLALMEFGELVRVPPVLYRKSDEDGGHRHDSLPPSTQPFCSGDRTESYREVPQSGPPGASQESGA
jgi:hypothetical protein